MSEATDNRSEENMSTAVKAPIQTQEQKLEECRRAGHWVGDMCCWNCGGEGLSDHDCGEDCCCCLHPENNVTCDICEGKGGWKICYTCNPEAYDDGY